MVVEISKKRNSVTVGIFKAELNEFLMWELAEDGYSGVEVQVTSTRTEIIILATRIQNVLGDSEEIWLFWGKCRTLCWRGGHKRSVPPFPGIVSELQTPMRPCRARACSGMLWFITESRVKDCEVMVSGKLQGQRAKSMKFVDGLMVHSEDPLTMMLTPPCAMCCSDRLC